jgi:AraC-like DNA-binding protein
MSNWSLQAIGALSRAYTHREAFCAPDRLTTITYFCPTARPILLFRADHLPPGKTVSWNSHPCVEMHGCLSGQITALTPAGERRLETGMFYLLAPGARHGWRNDGADVASRISFLVDADNPGAWPAASGVAAGCRKLKALVRGWHCFDVAGDAELQTIFWKLADCLGPAPARDPLTTTGLLWTFLGMVLERLAAYPSAAPGDAAHRIQRLLMCRISNRLTIAEIADQVGLSPTQAKRLFREAFGCGIRAYFERLKIQQAQRLLCDPALTVKQVSRRLGYSTPSYFAQVFYQHTGELPDDFRRRKRRPYPR